MWCCTDGLLHKEEGVRPGSAVLAVFTLFGTIITTITKRVLLGTSSLRWAYRAIWTGIPHPNSYLLHSSVTPLDLTNGLMGGCREPWLGSRVGAVNLYRDHRFLRACSAASRGGSHDQNEDRMPQAVLHRGLFHQVPHHHRRFPFGGCLSIGSV